jgi:hypothetical protein
MALTVIAVFAVKPLYEAVTVADPVPVAVIRPEVLTVATDVLLETYVAVLVTV